MTDIPVDTQDLDLSSSSRRIGHIATAGLDSQRFANQLALLRKRRISRILKCIL
jgi:hypothetical protein